MSRPVGAGRARSRTAIGARVFWRRLQSALAFARPTRRLPPTESYRIWSETYDAQPDNVVLALEEEAFFELLPLGLPTGRVVVDIGCGTGRHWRELRSRWPRSLHGVDSSPEMLAQLRGRYPDAMVHLRAGQRLEAFRDGTVDLIVSTLMLGHVADVAGELREWARLLEVGGEIVLTDFHPRAVEAGMRRTFVHRGTTFEVEHHTHTVEQLRSLCDSFHLEITRFEEKSIDETMRIRFERQNYAKVYHKHLGIPLVLGFRLRKLR